MATTPPRVGSEPGWSFAVNPYLWLPRISQTLQAHTPNGGTVTTNINVGPGDYLTFVNFAAMVGGIARYDRFSMMTDLIYLNDSITADAAHLSTVSLGQSTADISRSQQFHVGTRLGMTVWSLAGGYTLLQGDWGNVDGLAGLRMVAFDSTTNYQLNSDIQTPNHELALSRGGSFGIHNTYFNAIGGVSGRVNIPNSKFYLPFYADVGGGDLPLTWQIYGGVAYSPVTWADLSVGYRYLAFEKGASTGVKNMSLNGFTLGLNIKF
jgi:opacity protein-like surface antigen